MELTTERQALTADNRPPLVVPDHELLRVIGRGSYGEVWEARNIMGSRRAVKVVWRDDFALARPFDREFEGIQSYEPVSRSHAGLVQVLHVGMHPSQEYFYYVMELADAEDPAETCYAPMTLRGELQRRGALPIDECIEIGISLASGLGHLHRHGLVHRDVKPGNVIFVCGASKLADAGLVTKLGDGGSTVGTEGYYAPEGAGGERGDVFSLGKVLYECVTGMDRVCFPDVPTEWTDDAAGRAAFEFMEIVLRAAESNPERRYRDMDEMLADLALLQAGKSVRHLRRIEKNFQRVVRVLGIAALSVAVIGGAWLYERHRGNRIAQAEQSARQATEQSRRLLGESLVAEARAVRMSGQAGAREKALQAVKRGREAGADLLQLRSEAASALALTDVGPFSQPLPSEAHPGTHSLWSPDGASLVTLHPDGSVEVFTREATRTERRATWKAVPGARLGAVSRGARWLAVTTPERNLAVWDLHDGSKRWEAPGASDTTAVAFSDDGEWLVFSAPDGLVAQRCEGGERVMLAPGTPAARRLLLSRDATWIAMLPDDAEEHGFRIYTGLPGRMPQVSDAGAVQESQIPSSIRLEGPSISADSRYLAAAVSEDRVRVWEIPSLVQIATLRGHQRSVRGTAFHPLDSSLVASTSWDGTTRLWNVPARREVLVAPTGGDEVLLLPDRGEILLRTWDHRAVRVAALSRAGGLRSLTVPAQARSGLFSSVHFSPDGRLLAVAGDAGVLVWDLSTGSATLLDDRGPQMWREAVFSPDGATLWCSGSPGVVTYRVLDGAAGDRTEFSPATLVHGSAAGHVAWLPGRDVLAVAGGVVEGGRGSVRLFHPDGSPAGVIPVAFPPDRLASSADGRWLAATRYPEPGGLLWDLAADPPVVFPVEADGRSSFAFLSRLPWLAVGTDQTVRFLPLPAGAAGEATTLESAKAVLPRRDAEFVPGRVAECAALDLVAVTTGPTAVLLCEALSLEPLATLDSPLTCFDSVLAFSPDGSRLALAGGMSRVIVWEVAWIRKELAQRGLAW